MTGGVGSWIERRARIHPERLALAWGEERITYGDLAGRIRKLGHAFSSFGIGRGDRVGWLGPNHPAFLETFFAASSLGAALAPVKGTSLAMIDRTYGHLIRGSEAATIDRMNARREGLWHLHGTDEAVDVAR